MSEKKEDIIRKITFLVRKKGYTETFQILEEAKKQILDNKMEDLKIKKQKEKNDD